MKKITEKELNRPDNKYVDRIEGEQWKMTDKYPINIISNMGRIFSISASRMGAGNTSRPYKLRESVFHTKVSKLCAVIKRTKYSRPTQSLPVMPLAKV